MRIDFIFWRFRFMFVRWYSICEYQTWINLPTQCELYVKIPFTHHSIWVIYWKKQ